MITRPSVACLHHLQDNMEARLVHRPKAGNKGDPIEEKREYINSSNNEEDLSLTDVNQTHRKNSVLGVQSLLSFLILFSAWLVGFCSRLFAVVRFESIIHEFDPW